jgi:hypothetical protein
MFSPNLGDEVKIHHTGEHEIILTIMGEKAI